MPLVIQVERNNNSQNEINAYIKISGQPESLHFKVPVINMWKYELKDIIERQWYLLIPYCLMKYRQLFNSNKITDSQKDEFKSEMNLIIEKTHELHNDGKISNAFFPPLMKMIILVSNHINEKFIHNSEIRKQELTQMNSVLNPLGSTTIQKYLDEGEEKGKKAVAIDMLKDDKPLRNYKIHKIFRKNH